MKVNCPNCGQQYNIDDSRAGKTVQCATCSESFEVPDKRNTMAKPSPVVIKPGPVTIDIAPPPKDQGQKTCPMCGERILRVAKKCRYCGEFFENNANLPKKVDISIYMILAFFFGGIGMHNLYAGQYIQFIAHVFLSFAGALVMFVMSLEAGMVICSINLIVALVEMAMNPNK